MDLHMSTNEITLLLAQLQQQLDELKASETTLLNHQPMNHMSTKTPRTPLGASRSKAISMFNLADFEAEEREKAPKVQRNRRDSISQIFPNAESPSNNFRLPSGKSMNHLDLQVPEASATTSPKASGTRLRSSTSYSSLSSASVSALSNSSSSPNPPRSYRRFAHTTNPDFSFQDFWSKKRAAAEYAEELSQQIEEKRRNEARAAMMSKLRETLLDEKMAEDQKVLRREFEAEHRIRDEENEDKTQINGKQVKIEAETLPVISNNRSSHRKQFNASKGQALVSSELREATGYGLGTAKSARKPPRPQVNGNASDPAENSSNSSFKGPSQTVSTQTDDTLLFDLIHEFMVSEAIHRNAQQQKAAAAQKGAAGSVTRPKASTTASSTTSFRRTKSIDRSAAARATASSKPAFVYRRK